MQWHCANTIRDRRPSSFTVTDEKNDNSKTQLAYKMIKSAENREVEQRTCWFRKYNMDFEISPEFGISLRRQQWMRFGIEREMIIREAFNNSQLLVISKWWLGNVILIAARCKRILILDVNDCIYVSNTRPPARIVSILKWKINLIGKFCRCFSIRNADRAGCFSFPALSTFYLSAERKVFIFRSN